MGVGIGSSPLTRGKPHNHAARVAERRLIPAHAGKTSCYAAYSVSQPAHPRSRGENGGSHAAAPQGDGSSPLTRGKPEREQAETSSARLIPAHAGKTPAPFTMLVSPTAHPRSRGENSWFCSMRRTASGSSPLTRGKQCRAVARWLRRRLIPAHAGKTRCGHLGTVACPAHPRSRGENEFATAQIEDQAGSSPLTRGKPAAPGHHLDAGRLIPAHAGKTWANRPTTRLRPAHPRSRGENEGARFRRWQRHGSSPLTRGKLLVLLDAAHRVRLIPAHAGKT